MNQCAGTIEKTIVLAQQLIANADSGDMERCDDTSGVFWAIVRDNAYKILHEAEKECERYADRKAGTGISYPKGKVHDE